jgi:hypothetical protein
MYHSLSLCNAFLLKDFTTTILVLSSPLILVHISQSSTTHHRLFRSNDELSRGDSCFCSFDAIFITPTSPPNTTATHSPSSCINRGVIAGEIVSVITSLLLIITIYHFPWGGPVSPSSRISQEVIAGGIVIAMTFLVLIVMIDHFPRVDWCTP